MIFTFRLAKSAINEKNAPLSKKERLELRKARPKESLPKQKTDIEASTCTIS